VEFKTWKLEKMEIYTMEMHVIVKHSLIPGETTDFSLVTNASFFLQDHIQPIWLHPNNN